MWVPNSNGKQVVRLNNSMEWREYFGPTPNRLVDRMGQAHRETGLSSETYTDTHQNLGIQLDFMIIVVG